MPVLDVALKALNKFTTGSEPLENLLASLVVVGDQDGANHPTPQHINDLLNQDGRLLGGSADDAYKLNAADAKTMRDAAFLHLVRLRLSQLNLDNGEHKAIVRDFLGLDLENALALQNFVGAYGTTLGLSHEVRQAVSTECFSQMPTHNLRATSYALYMHQLCHQVIATCNNVMLVSQLLDYKFQNDVRFKDDRAEFRLKLKTLLQDSLGYGKEVNIDRHIAAMTFGDLATDNTIKKMRGIHAVAFARTSKLLLSLLAAHPNAEVSNTVFRGIIAAKDIQNIQVVISTALEDDSIKQQLGDAAAANLAQQLEEAGPTLTAEAVSALRSQALKIHIDNLFNFEPPRGLDTTDAAVLAALEGFVMLVDQHYTDHVAADADEAQLRAARVAAIKHVLSSRETGNVADALTYAQKQALFNTSSDVEAGSFDDEDCLSFLNHCQQLQASVTEQLDYAQGLSFENLFDVLVPPPAVVMQTQQAPITQESIVTYLRGNTTDPFVAQEWVNEGDGSFRARAADFEEPEVFEDADQTQLYNQLGTLLLRLQVLANADEVDDEMAEAFAGHDRVTAPTQAANLHDCYLTATYAATITNALLTQFSSEIAQLQAAENTQPSLEAQYHLMYESLSSRYDSLRGLANYYEEKEKLFKLRNGVDGVAATALGDQDRAQLKRLRQAALLAYAEVQRISAHDWQQHLNTAGIDADHITVGLSDLRLVESEEQFRGIGERIDTTVYKASKPIQKEGVVSFELGVKDAKEKAEVTYKKIKDDAVVTVKGASKSVVQAFVALYQARLVAVGVLLKQADGKVVSNPAASAEQKQQAQFSVSPESLTLTIDNGEPLAADKQTEFFASLTKALKTAFGNYYIEKPAAPGADPKGATADGRRPAWQRRASGSQPSAPPFANEGGPGMFASKDAKKDVVEDPASVVVPTA